MLHDGGSVGWWCACPGPAFLILFHHFTTPPYQQIVSVCTCVLCEEILVDSSIRIYVTSIAYHITNEEVTWHESDLFPHAHDDARSHACSCRVHIRLSVVSSCVSVCVRVCVRTLNERAVHWASVCTHSSRPQKHVSRSGAHPHQITSQRTAHMYVVSIRRHTIRMMTETTTATTLFLRSDNIECYRRRHHLSHHHPSPSTPPSQFCSCHWRQGGILQKVKEFSIRRCSCSYVFVWCVRLRMRKSMCVFCAGSCSAEVTFHTIVQHVHMPLYATQHTTYLEHSTERYAQCTRTQLRMEALNRDLSALVWSEECLHKSRSSSLYAFRAHHLRWIRMPRILCTSWIMDRFQWRLNVLLCNNMNIL